MANLEHEIMGDFFIPFMYLDIPRSNSVQVTITIEKKYAVSRELGKRKKPQIISSESRKATYSYLQG